MAESRRLSNDERLMQRFLAEVRTHYKQERRVIYYAERLHITTGYLSTLVHRVSGKSPSDWINDFVVMEAKVLLKSSTLTVQQIAHELNFPSQSFFGKYFKRLVGLSPKEYREGEKLR
jgi:AraC-like DNA-binding protein